MASEFQFAEKAKAQLATPRWMRNGMVMGLGISLLVISIFAGERIKDWYYASTLEGRWIGTEVEPGGLWTREVEYDFRRDGTVENTLRMLRQGDAKPEVSTATLLWSIRSGHIIFTSAGTGDIATRIHRIRKDALTFSGQAKIKDFKRIP
jgi:hypothetical protein